MSPRGLVSRPPSHRVRTWVTLAVYSRGVAQDQQPISQSISLQFSSFFFRIHNIGARGSVYIAAYLNLLMINLHLFSLCYRNL